METIREKGTISCEICHVSSGSLISGHPVPIQCFVDRLRFYYSKEEFRISMLGYYCRPSMTQLARTAIGTLVKSLLLLISPHQPYKQSIRSGTKRREASRCTWWDAPKKTNGNLIRMLMHYQNARPKMRLAKRPQLYLLITIPIDGRPGQKGKYNLTSRPDTRQNKTKHSIHPFRLSFSHWVYAQTQVQGSCS